MALEAMVKTLTSQVVSSLVLGKGLGDRPWRSTASSTAVIVNRVCFVERAFKTTGHSLRI